MAFRAGTERTLVCTSASARALRTSGRNVAMVVKVGPPRDAKEFVQQAAEAAAAARPGAAATEQGRKIRFAGFTLSTIEPRAQ